MLNNLSGIWEKYSYVYFEGLLGTIRLASMTVLFATLLGGIVALMKMSKIRPLEVITQAYIGIIRGTPILLQLYFFRLLLPKVLPGEVSDGFCILVALIINASSYIAEIIRAGIQAVDRGQLEAGMSLGMSKKSTFKKVILPQATKNILPALGNEYIAAVKETSLASVFFVSELTTSYKTVQSATFLSIPSLAIAGLIYLFITSLLNRLIGLQEKKMA